MKDEEFMNELDLRSKELKRKLGLLNADDPTEEQVIEINKPENSLTYADKQLLFSSLLIAKKHDKTFNSG